MKRTVPLLLFAAMLAVTAFAAPASAGLDYGGVCSVNVEPPIVAAGGQLTITGEGFQPNFGTQVILDEGQGANEEVLADVTTEADGTFQVQVTVPADANGLQHTITVPCDGTGNNATTEVLILNAGQTNSNAALALSKALVRRLEQFNATVTLAQPGSTVTFFQRSTETQVGTATANGDGVATLAMAFPSSASLGPHEVVARGTDLEGDAFDLVSPITVAADPAVGGDGSNRGSTPRTGSDVGPQVAAGTGVLLAGAAFVFISRRRRNQAVAS